MLVAYYLAQDVVDLRKRGWQPQTEHPGPPPLSHVHQMCKYMHAFALYSFLHLFLSCSVILGHYPSRFRDQTFVF